MCCDRVRGARKPAARGRTLPLWPTDIFFPWTATHHAVGARWNGRSTEEQTVMAAPATGGVTGADQKFSRPDENGAALPAASDEGRRAAPRSAKAHRGFLTQIFPPNRSAPPRSPRAALAQHQRARSRWDYLPSSHEIGGPGFGRIARPATAVRVAATPSFPPRDYKR